MAPSHDAKTKHARLTEASISRTAVKHCNGNATDRRAGGYSIVRGDWKGVVVKCANKDAPTEADDFELYNLADDPFEEKNVASGNAETVASLRALVLAGNYTCHCFQC